MHMHPRSEDSCRESLPPTVAKRTCFGESAQDSQTLEVEDSFEVDGEVGQVQEEEEGGEEDGDEGEGGEEAQEEDQQDQQDQGPIFGVGLENHISKVQERLSAIEGILSKVFMFALLVLCIMPVSEAERPRSPFVK